MVEVNERSQPSRASVLVVDDTPANLVALEALIRPLGHEVVTAQSGAQAIELVSKREFSVILLDVMMPGLDGFQTLECMRTLPLAKSTPVLFLTARMLDSHSLRRAYALGAVDYITKPVASEVLLGKLSAFVSLYQQSQEIRRQADALRAKDRHLGVLAHDLRNPLSVIGMAAARLEQHEDMAVQTAAQRIHRAVKRIQNLADDLLEFARMAAGQIAVTCGPMDLREVCTELLDDFEATYPRVKFERELPEPLTGTWDRTRLQQALSNLLANAVKYGTGWVRVSARREADRIRLVVENGCATAMGHEELERLFAPFMQGQARRAGVGLGLYIVREIARAHGGDAYGHWVDGRIAFTVELSALPNAECKTTSTPPEPEVSDTLVRMRRSARFLGVK